MSARDAFTRYTFHCTDQRAPLRACTHATLGMATAVRTQATPAPRLLRWRSTIRAERRRCCRDAAWRFSGRKAGWRFGGRDGYGRHCRWRCGRRGCKSHARPMLAHGADGRRGNGNELRGGRADLEVVLRGGSGTGQYWQYFRPSSSLLPLRLHKPHRPLTVSSVTRTSLRMDNGPSSPTRLNHAFSRLLSTN